MNNSSLFEKMFDALQGANISVTHLQINNGDGTMTINNYAPSTPAANGADDHYPLQGTEAIGREVMRRLVEGGFIAPATAEADWLFLMGYSAVRPATPQPITWLKSKQLAREMLFLRCRPLLDGNCLTPSAITGLAPRCFVREDGKPLELSKNRPEPSADSDRLKEIFSVPAPQ